MSGRIKLLLALLAAGAGLTFWFASSYSIADIAPATISDSFEQTPAQTLTCDDQDADGLCDYDETYWRTDYKNPDSDGDGFKDGEEVLSGHSPVKAGPDDFLNDKRNLTQRTSALLLGGIVAGDLNPKSEKYNDSMDALVDQIFEQYDANVASELDSISLVPDSKEAILLYSYRMANILQPMFSEITANHTAVLETIRGIPLTDISSLAKLHPQAATALASVAGAEATAFSDRVGAVRSIRVPASLEAFHRSLLLYLRGTQQRYTSLKNIANDPLGAVISLQVLETLTLATPLDLSTSLQQSLNKALAIK